MDFNSIKNPQVREYIRRKMSGEEDLSQAQDVQAGIGYANIAGSALTDLANSNKQDVILGNRLDSLGRAPKVVSSPDKQYDDMGSGKLAAQGVSRAEQSLAGIEAPPTVRDEEDPGSPVSKLWQDTANKAAPGKDFSQFSASQLRKVMPSLEKHMPKKTEANRSDPREERLRDIKLETAEAKLAKAKAPAAPKATQSEAAGYGRRIEQAMKNMEEIGATDFDRTDFSSGLGSYMPDTMRSDEALSQDQAESNFINAVLRRESGAAISDTEFDKAEKQYFPRPGDGERTLAQKKANREQILVSLKGEAGSAWDVAKPSTPKNPTELKDPSAMSIEELEAELGGS